MSDELAAILDDLHELGYETVDRVEGFESEASGRVPLPEEHRREPETDWRRYLPGSTATRATRTSCPTTCGKRSRPAAGPSRRWGGATTR
ncbi:hypothetical protein ACFQL4_01935 [Halosimplex aquaticum]